MTENKWQALRDVINRLFNQNGKPWNKECPKAWNDYIDQTQPEKLLDLLAERDALEAEVKRLKEYEWMYKDLNDER